MSGNNYIKCRFRFEKTGRAKYLSHLDLMRTFQRAFVRGGIDVRHTEGFNPHPYISIVLPLQLGSESICELLDAEVVVADYNELGITLNTALPEGIRILSVAPPVMKPGEVGYARYSVGLNYTDAAPTVLRAKAAMLKAFLASGSLVITKKTKRGYNELDIAPHITEHEVKTGDRGIMLTALFSAFEPTCNPSDLTAALNLNEDLKPSHASYKRLEIYNKDKSKFI